jgi:hypothetical protein
MFRKHLPTKFLFIRTLLIALTMCLAQPALAMRCGTKLVNKGDHQSQVRKYCGEPTHVQVRTAYRSHSRTYSNSGMTVNGSSINNGSRAKVRGGYSEEVIIEEWTYNFGPNKLMRIVRFENGIVENVDETSRGYRE